MYSIELFREIRGKPDRNKTRNKTERIVFKLNLIGISIFFFNQTIIVDNTIHLCKL